MTHVKTLGWVLILLGVFSWMQERDWQDKQQAQVEYTRALEQTLARCLGPDQTIVVGDELWLCGATRTGVRL